MTSSFLNSFSSEWIKKRRTLASWLVIVGGFFTPCMIILARILRAEKLPAYYSSPHFWETLWRNAWESMALFLLPVGVILATSLITQLEYRNNTWKQLHIVPLSFTTLFFSKLAVIVVMLLQFFIFFNFGLYLSAVVPSLIFSSRGVPYPQEPIPFINFLKENVYYFVDCLPIVALQ
ncbi:MAG: ABC transporter permease, partial [Bacteroidetes bacterium]|nr:ABC transporter permease [Bacteroidota bacterium]